MEREGDGEGGNVRKPLMGDREGRDRILVV
jgi:hypothetical protein